MNPDVLLVSAFGVAIGLPVLAAGLWQFRREISPRGWIKVPGAILSATIDKQATGRGGYQFVPKIEYEYRCDDRLFRSSQRRPGNYTSGRKRSAEAICSRYAAGGAVTVLVDPKCPDRAVLEYGPTPLSWILIGIGTLFSTLSLMSLVIQ